MSGSLKQLEALVWIARLGSFQRAADRLNTTQSAISKRVQELEVMSQRPLFDRTARTARLTSHGRALMTIAERMLDLRNEADALMRRDAARRINLRLGVTEITALTWLPTLILALRDAYPNADLASQVDTGETIFNRMRNGELDIAILPDAFRDHRFANEPVGALEMAWMYSPSMELPSGLTHVKDLEQIRLIVQETATGWELALRPWLAECKAALNWTVTTNSLITLMGLTLAGLGVSLLPRDVFGSVIASGRLRVLDLTPPIPPIIYSVMTRLGPRDGDEEFVIASARAACDFRQAIWRTPE